MWSGPCGPARAQAAGMLRQWIIRKPHRDVIDYLVEYDIVMVYETWRRLSIYECHTEQLHSQSLAINRFEMLVSFLNVILTK